MILVIMAIFGGIYYYYTSSKVADSSAKTVTKSETKADVVNTNNSKDSIISKTDSKIKNINNFIKPSVKADIAKIALLSAGKADPFTDTISITGNIISNSSLKHTSHSPYSLPMPPSIKGLPVIGQLPKISLSGLPSDQTYIPGSLSVQDGIRIKGFIGNKVIVDINGAIEALKVNEKFRSIKVLQIDPAGLSAEFMKDGKTLPALLRVWLILRIKMMSC